MRTKKLQNINPPDKTQTEQSNGQNNDEKSALILRNNTISVISSLNDSNNHPEEYNYLCYYCDYNTNNKDHYERHVVLRHDHSPAYPNKAEIEKRGLKPQGRSWEI
jgi:hypothetical protein